MTTSQNAPAPQWGRHHRAGSSDRPVEYAGPRPANQPQAWPQPVGRFTGDVQRPQITAQWSPGPAYRAGPAQPYSAQSGPVQHYYQPYSGPAPAQPAQAHPRQSDPARNASTRGAPAQPYAPRPIAPAQAEAPTPVPAPVHVPAPRNGLGIAALCLGIVGMLFGLVPFTGFIAFALGAIGVILGLVGFARARRRLATNTKTAVSGVVLSALALALGIWGMVIVFTGLSQLSEDLNQISSPSGTTASGGTAVPADISSPATTAPRTYQLEVTGDASKMMVAYGTNNAVSSAADYQSLPWRKTVEAAGDLPYASVTTTSYGPGSITCTITDTATGAVVATQTSQSLDDSEYSSATASCNTMG